MNECDKTSVYIGPGWCIPGHQNGPKLQDNFKYICIETPKTNLWNSVSQGFYDRLLIPVKKRVHFVRASGDETGLEDCSVDEVHLHNILGDVRIKDRVKIFIEAIRITKIAGCILIGETLTPYPLGSLIEIGIDNGLISEVLINGNKSKIRQEDKETFYKIIGEYYRPSDRVEDITIRPDSYLVKFQKSKTQ